VQVVNVLVTPDQAEVLSLASSQTSIRMTLRNPLDHDIAKTPGTAMKYVWGGMASMKGAQPTDDAPPVATPRARPVAERPREIVAAAPKKEQPFVMEILSGAARTETKFEKTPEVNK
jgi:pilus assembly protein CpaB